MTDVTIGVGWSRENYGVECAAKAGIRKGASEGGLEVTLEGSWAACGLSLRGESTQFLEAG